MACLRNQSMYLIFNTTSYVTLVKCLQWVIRPVTFSNESDRVLRDKFHFRNVGVYLYPCFSESLFNNISGSKKKLWTRKQQCYFLLSLYIRLNCKKRYFCLFVSHRIVMRNIIINYHLVAPSMNELFHCLPIYIYKISYLHPRSIITLIASFNKPVFKTEWSQSYIPY